MKLITRPATTASGRRRRADSPSVAPATNNTGSTGSTHGDTPAITPATMAMPSSPIIAYQPPIALLHGASPQAVCKGRASGSQVHHPSAPKCARTLSYRERVHDGEIALGSPRSALEGAGAERRGLQVMTERPLGHRPHVRNGEPPAALSTCDAVASRSASPRLGPTSCRLGGIGEEPATGSERAGSPARLMGFVSRL